MELNYRITIIDKDSGNPVQGLACHNFNYVEDFIPIMSIENEAGIYDVKYYERTEKFNKASDKVTKSINELIDSFSELKK